MYIFELESEHLHQWFEKLASLGIMKASFLNPLKHFTAMLFEGVSWGLG